MNIRNCQLRKRDSERKEKTWKKRGAAEWPPLIQPRGTTPHRPGLSAIAGGGPLPKTCGRITFLCISLLFPSLLMTTAEFKLFIEVQIEFTINELAFKTCETDCIPDHVVRTIPGILDAERPLPPDKNRHVLPYSRIMNHASMYPLILLLCLPCLLKII